MADKRITTTHVGNLVRPDGFAAQLRKLRSLAEGAQLASKELRGKAAA